MKILKYFELQDEFNQQNEESQNPWSYLCESHEFTFLCLNFSMSKIRYYHPKVIGTDVPHLDKLICIELEDNHQLQLYY